MANSMAGRPIITLRVAVLNKNGKPYIHHIVSHASTMDQGEFSRIQSTIKELLLQWGYNSIVTRDYFIPEHFRLISAREFSKLNDVFLSLDLDIYSLFSRHPYKISMRHSPETPRVDFRTEALEYINKYFGLSILPLEN